MKITAIVGTYRKGGMIDAAVDEILASASEQGAEVEKIHLLDRHIEFCTNCRACTQQPGEKRGECRLADDMTGILNTIEQSDGLIFASPMNFGTVTAIMKRFLERFVCYAWWPWGRHIPKMRSKRKDKRAVVVTSSAAPAIMVRLLTRMTKPMVSAGQLVGAKTVASLYIGLAAKEQKPKLNESIRKRARQLGKKLTAEL